MGLKEKVTKVEAIKIVLVSDSGDPEPEVYYLLPSGYKDSAIEVHESAAEELDVQLVFKSKLDSYMKKV